ncbi:chaplin family protein [Actinoplanes sp. GCM10030250]|uniref:chaplin family protein n=1 Tax=Actinoplanes sp. GCM10030250 TaxID=3273376 RepID=UPI003614C601
MKKTWVRKTLSVGILAAGALLFAPAAAQADEIDQLSAGNSGIGTGNQISLPITVPVNLVGNSAAVAGFSQAQGVGNNVLLENGRNGRNGGGTKVGQLAAGNSGFLTGNQISVPITVPVNVAGNSAAVLGKSTGVGVANNVIAEESARTEGFRDDRRGGDVDSVGQLSAGNSGFLTGNQVSVPITVPINACGNSLALLGASQGVGVCNNVIGVPNDRRSWNQESKTARHAESGCCDNDGDRGGRGTRVGQLSAGNRGFVTGNQISAPITVPINACGNSLGALLGHSTAVGSCNNVITSADDNGRRQVRWIKPGQNKPIWGLDDDVFGDGGVRPGHGHGHGDHPGGVRDNDDDDRGYGDKDDDGDVRGDNGYKGNKDDRGNKGDGYGKPGSDLADDGYGKPGADNAGYGDEKPAKYGDKKTGGRMTEKSPVPDLSENLGGIGSAGLGGLDLLQAVR